VIYDDLRVSLKILGVQEVVWPMARVKSCIMIRFELRKREEDEEIIKIRIMIKFKKSTKI